MNEYCVFRLLDLTCIFFDLFFLQGVKEALSSSSKGADPYLLPKHFQFVQRHQSLLNVKQGRAEIGLWRLPFNLTYSQMRCVIHNGCPSSNQALSRYLSLCSPYQARLGEHVSS
jgi:hypothetical protein